MILAGNRARKRARAGNRAEKQSESGETERVRRFAAAKERAGAELKRNKTQKTYNWQSESLTIRKVKYLQYVK
jgi:hypothetical protein